MQSCKTGGPGSLYTAGARQWPYSALPDGEKGYMHFQEMGVEISTKVLFLDEKNAGQARSEGPADYAAGKNGVPARLV